MKTRSALLFLAATVLLAACGRPSIEDLKQQLVAADKAFSERSRKDGPEAAFRSLVMDDTKLLSNFTLGPEGVRQTFMQFPKTMTLDWEPSYADVSASGDLGYTWGRYTLFVPSSVKGQPPMVRKGNYVTIWKRQFDGSWKVALDGGNADGTR
jgi:ketosteroid isomerase-like protein